MTVDEMRAMVRLSTMVDSGEISDAQLLTWLNDGVHDVSMRHNWPWLESATTFPTVSGTEGYARSDLVAGEELQEVLYVTISGDSRPLHPISYSQSMSRWGDAPTTGTPQYWYIFKEEIVLRPIPNSIVTVKVTYVPPPAEMSDGSDSPVFLATFHGLLVDYLENKVWRQQEDFAKANTSLASYYDRVDQMKRAYGKRTNRGNWSMGAGRDTRSGRNEPFRNDWGDAQV